MAEERTYLYCVTDAEVEVPAALTGLADQPVQTLRAGDCAAWFSVLEAAPPVSIAAVQAHNAVVQAALERAEATVPVRFGQVLEGTEALRRHLEQQDGYGEQRARVRGCVEFAIRILLRPGGGADADAGEARTHAADPARGTARGSGAGADSGTSYLQARARDIHRQRRRKEQSSALAEAMAERLDPLVRDRRIELAEQPPGAMVAHLVQRSRAEAYLQEARRLAEDVEGGRALVTGPWPPYSFVEGG